MTEIKADRRDSTSASQLIQFDLLSKVSAHILQNLDSTIKTLDSSKMVVRRVTASLLDRACRGFEPLLPSTLRHIPTISLGALLQVHYFNRASSIHCRPQEEAPSPSRREESSREDPRVVYSEIGIALLLQYLAILPPLLMPQPLSRRRFSTL